MDPTKRSLALFILIFLTHYGTALERRHRHGHGRAKRQHTPDSYVLDVEGVESGDWGPWSPPAACSRSCGGGVSYQTRQCRPDSRQPCEGATRRHFSCNIQDCPEGSVDFRVEQCAEFNNVPFDDVYYTWIPYTKAPNKCELNCMPKGERFYYRHKDKVADGTRCEEEKLDVCVDGKCLPVGCDHLLGSSAREDQCRECGGDGSSCNTARGLLENDDLVVGYNDLLLIPAGATNIRVREVRPSNNYLAIRNETGHYYLNGNWRIDFPRSIKACGTIFHYERKPHGFFAPEMISALGPTLEPIYIVLLYQEKNPGIEFEYSIPKGAVQDTDPEGYTWVYNEFGPCSATCGGGVRTRNVWCAKRKDSAEVSRDLCNEQLEPPSTEECAPEPCAPQWTVSEWGPCSQTCGSGGTQTRQVICEQIISGGRGSLVNSLTCEETLGPAPPTTQPCGEGPPCPTWHIGPWKPCDKLCGEGKQRRDVICFRKVDGRIEKMSDEGCPGEKPDTEMDCMLRPCEGVDWVTTEWSGCEEKCGLAYETRQVFCSTEKGVIFPDSFCQKSQVPELQRECKTTEACKHQWFASQWSECSAQCGPGVQTRKVFCGSFTDEGVQKADDTKCDAGSRYENTKNCTGEQVCKGSWFSGPWSPCSRPCGGGQKTRKVLCMLNNETVPTSQCDQELILFSSSDCNNFACGTDQIITVAPEHKVYEGFDEEDEEEEDCDDTDYYDEITSTDGILLYSPDFESSGSSPGMDGQTAFTSASDSLSLASEELMLSDEPSLTSTSGSSSTSLLVTFGSSEFTEGSGSGSSILPTTAFEGSGDSPFSTVSSLGSEMSSEPSPETSTVSSSGFESTDSSSDSVSTTEDVSSVSSVDVSSVSSVDVSSVSSESSLMSSSSESSGSSLGVSDGSSSDSSVTSTEANDESTIVSTESSFSVETTGISATSESINSSESSDSSDFTDPSDNTKSSDDTESSSPTETTSELPTDTTLDSSSDSSPENSISTDGSTSQDLETSYVSAESASSSSDSATSADVSSTTEQNVNPNMPRLTDVDPDYEDSSENSTMSSTESSDSTSENSTLSSTEFSDPTSVESTTDQSSTDTEISTAASDLSSLSSLDITTISSSDITSTSESLSTEVSDIGQSTISSELSSSISSQSSETYDSTISSEQPTTTYSESSSVASEVSTSSSVTEEGISSVTSPSYGASTTELISIFSPELTTAAAKARKKKCKRRKKKNVCLTSEFGCCYDNVTPAKGPFNKGCPVIETCKDTKHGCCPDGVSPATGPNLKGCPASQCNLTLFGCCPDGVSIAQGNDFEDCPEEPTTPTDCKASQFGCCSDGATPASGPNKAGCPECEVAGACEPCNETTHGCCPDGVQPAAGPENEGCDLELTTEFVTVEYDNGTDCQNTTYGCCLDGIIAADGPEFEGCEELDELVNCTDSEYGCCPDGNTTATGPNEQGCPAACGDQPFGCCQDNATPAHGPNKEGCCLLDTFGCCPDNILPAQGPNLEGCGCQYTTYGCCPDNKTAARGTDNQGCGCQYTPHGCCPNQYTPAAGPGYQGCPCYTYQFGCCPDGITRAIGPNSQGCGCENSEFGCCPDGHTPAPGPDRVCPCVASSYGCCPDGVSEALDENFAGCENVPLGPGEVCTLSKDRGTCREFTVKWFYDTEYGGCSRFWYGGCDGNENRFKTQDECKQKCVEPPGRDACYLPKIEGPCDGYYPTWYYDVDRKQCGQFVYGGCLGNGNKFETRELCEDLCVTPDTIDACEKPAEEGPCQGNFTRWFYDKESESCSTFSYGGCKGNNNNFLTELACQQKCLQPGRSKVMDVCGLVKDPGPCPGTVMRWYYNSDSDTCNQFIYGGCQGNANRFRTEAECVHRCIDPTPDECALPRAQGSCGERLPRWFFDASENRCMPFYYSGCDGNGNNFETRKVCEQTCPPKIEQHTCLLPALVGECHNYTARWYFDSLESQCRQFYFGGCGGNNNNFETQEDCQRSCDPSGAPPPPPPYQPQPQPEQLPQPVVITTAQPDIPFTTEMCFLPDDAGECRGSVPKWFYDSRDGVCKQFLYGGCNGNGNRFDSRQECEIRCGNIQDLCTLPLVVGPCDGIEPSYYYDKQTDTCSSFDYGGCQGNSNRFRSVEECEQRCRRRPQEPVVTAPPPPRKSDICYLPVERGPCSEQVAAWFFDPSVGQCQAFVYGGCEGNANRFTSTEQCERQCGIFLGQDVCNVPVDVGPCLQQLAKWYYDPVTRSCQEFPYGGCDGSANRFSSLPECESICLHREELIPQTNASLSYQAICKLPVDSGPCQDGQFTRWAFDERQQTCIAFTYHGCAGNLNRFKSFRACLDYCIPGYSAMVPVTDPPNEIDVDGGVEKDRCADVQSACANMQQCPYGVERWVDSNGCENCRCNNPCVSQNVQCPPNATCTIALASNPETGQTEYKPVCRQVYKTGTCPVLSGTMSHCTQECLVDADCSGTAKCCYNGCGTSCLEPVSDIVQTAAPDTLHPGNSPPQIYADTPEVEADEGYFVTLQCRAGGNPTPSVYWERGGATLSAAGGRYKFLSEGSLQIVGLAQTDAGEYICVADNGIGEPARKHFHVRVRGAKNRPAAVLGDDSQAVVVTLGTRAVLQCYAYGYPAPLVTWWRGERMLPISSPDLEQRRDLSLVLFTVKLTSLGPYTCQAYNGIGRAASWTVTLKAVGPVYSPDPNDVTYNQYLVPPPRSPPDHQPHPPPYRPFPPRVQPTLPPPTAATVRVFVVPVKTKITMEKTTFPVDSDISIPCDVDGYPVPSVVWYKDNLQLQTSEKIQISESSRLTVVRASANDSGTYKCEAANQYDSSYAEVKISVEGIYVHPECTDNTFFADCHLVVKGKYCTHKYYGKFCCRSCTLAGQLPSHGPHLANLKRRRRSLPLTRYLLR